MKLNDLRDNPGATKGRMRIGRGMGKTSGKGVKGQKARTGVAVKGFEGGQMPLHRRLPKRGFTNIFAKSYVAIGLDRIQKAIDAGKLDAAATVDAAALAAAGIVRRTRDGVRILANGELKAKAAFKVAGASRAAVEAIEKAGGSVEILGKPAEAEGADKQ